MNASDRPFSGKSVLVTGGSGLVGSAFVAELLERGALVRTVRNRRPPPPGVEVVDGDLRSREACLRACDGVDAVIHAAGVSGGSKNVTIQGIPMFTDNLLMNTEMLECARLRGVGQYLFVSNSSVYAKSENLLNEDDAWGETSRGIPENETGMVKRAGETQCGLYSRFTDMRIAIVRGANTYGPNDNFDLQASHVLPALIHKAVDRMDPFVLWGSGDTIRDFIHNRDLAAGGLHLLERAVAGRCHPVNIGTGRTVSIRELTEVVLEEAGYPGATVVLDPTAPLASPAKRLDLTRMGEVGFSPSVPLREGIRQTIAWYRTHRG